MQRCAAEKELDRGDRSLEAQVRENGRSVKGTGGVPIRSMYGTFTYIYIYIHLP